MQHCSFEKHKSTLFFEKNSQPQPSKTLFNPVLPRNHAVNTVFPKRYSTLFFPLKLVNPFLPRHYSTLTIWCTITVSTKCRPNVYKLEFIFTRGQICTDCNCEFTLCQILQRLQLLTYIFHSLYYPMPHQDRLRLLPAPCRLPLRTIWPYTFVF